MNTSYRMAVVEAAVASTQIERAVSRIILVMIEIDGGHPLTEAQ